MDRKIPMEAAPELRAVLWNRLRITEQVGLAGVGGTTSPARHPPQRSATASGPLMGASSRVAQGAPPPSSRSAASHHGKGNRSLPGSASASPKRSAYSNGCGGGSNHQHRAEGRADAGAGLRRDLGLEHKIRELTARNEKLSQEVEALRPKSAQEATNLFCEERQQLLAHSEQLIMHTDQLMVARQQRLIEQQEEVKAEARELRAREAESGRKVRELQDEVKQLRQQNEALSTALDEARRSPSPSRPYPAASSSSSCSGCRLRAAMTSQGATPGDLRSAIGAAESLLDEARRELANKELRQRRAAFERLHHAMDAKTGPDIEPNLEAAIAEAKASGVDEHDLQAAEKILAELKALTPEERARRALRELETKRKKEAYYLVKKDDADGLSAFLDNLEEGLEWQGWRDYAGRTLRRCAQELRAAKAEAVLVARQLRRTSSGSGSGWGAAGGGTPERHQAPRIPPAATEPFRRTGSPRGSASGQPCFRARSLSGGSSGGGGGGASAELPAAGLSAPEAASAEVAAVAVDAASAAHVFDRKVSPESAPPAAVAPHEGSPGERASGVEHGEGEAPGAEGGDGAAAGGAEEGAAEVKAEIVPPSPEEEAELKAQALRAVVRDDVEALTQVLERVPLAMWSKWENKAGKDLLTLSQERGSSCAYSLLANALGLIKEVKRDFFEERETVWVFIPGDVQPHRATVLEDTPEEADTILVEWWDGDADPEYVDRCTVRKMWS